MTPSGAIEGDFLLFGADQDLSRIHLDCVVVRTQAGRADRPILAGATRSSLRGSTS